MNSNEKRKLTSLNNIELFRKSMKKLTLNEELTEIEKEYLLSSAILLSKEYELNRGYTSYLELSYYIILKYAITYQDYTPLYDFSINFGYYPIANTISKLNLIRVNNINDILIEKGIKRFKRGDIIETYEQKYAKDNILKCSKNEIAYIAPTSYGKSSIITEKILNDGLSKIGIIVPTKSLINQTYQQIKKQKLNYKIIMFDEMYENEEKFIAVVTQERALRLLDKENLFFDEIFIDEAHNLLDNKYRSLLIARLLNKNLKKNPEQRVIYLSPLVENSNNLKSYQDGDIKEYKIKFNLKEPEIYELKLNGVVQKYNRFVNEFYPIRENESILPYIIENSKNKNFIFISRPIKIEKFAKELSDYITEEIESEEIEELIRLLKEYVHEDFEIIDFIKKGIVYLHGKMPDQIKDYLEYKYKNIIDIKYLIANHVILEGMNLPIENLYIMTVNFLNEKQLINLIGRVNRLNDIFTLDKNNLYKLLPSIHFLNSEEYNRKQSDMENKILELRSFDLSDKVENPVLKEYDENKLNLSEEKKDKNKKIIENENKIYKDNKSEDSILEKILIETGVINYYENTQELITRIKKVKMIITNIQAWKNLHIIDKIYCIFINSLTGISDYEIKRLRYKEAKEFYKQFINNRKFNLKERIKNQFKYFKEIKNIPEKSQFYIGESYGEIVKTTEDYRDNFKKVYVDLKDKTDKELLNIAIVKIKIEDDFINYKLNSFLNIMLKMEFIDENEYNEVVYGTNNLTKLNLIKKGLTVSLINKFETDNQLQNLSFDMYNNIIPNNLFIEYKNTLDDFLQFEISKYI